MHRLTTAAHAWPGHTPGLDAEENIFSEGEGDDEQEKSDSSLLLATEQGRTAALQLLVAAAPARALLQRDDEGCTPLDRALDRLQGGAQLQAARLLLSAAPAAASDETIFAVNGNAAHRCCSSSCRRCQS